MSLDAFSVVVGFLAAVEIALGLTAAALGFAQARRAAARAAEPDTRGPLLALVSFALVAVALICVPVYYLLLQSWVTRWEGVMCIEGVRRIGAGSAGAARLLPGLVSAIDFVKPAVVFVGGAWVVLRRATGVRGLRFTGFAAIALGVAAVFDGAAQAAYVLIPKQIVPAVGGCCMTTTHDALAGGAAGGTPGALVTAVFVAATGAAGVASMLARGSGVVSGALGRTLILAVVGVSVPFAVNFLADVAAPGVLHQPFHHCVWCMFAAAPETIVAAALYACGVCCVGWAWLARVNVYADVQDPAPRLFATAGFCLLAAVSMSLVLVA